MDRYTRETACWLDLRFDRQAYDFMGKAYDPYQPLFGLRTEDWNAERFLMVSRWARLLSLLEGLRPGSFLDVGGAEGLVANLVSQTLGISAVSVDLSHQAALRAKEFFQLPTAAADSARLPFADDAFDVVFMSEVIEHLAHPVRSLLEARRVARLAVIVTTEAFAGDEAARQEELDERRLSPHMDRSIFCEGDFAKILAPWRILTGNQCARLPESIPGDPAQREAVFADSLAVHEIRWPSHGIIAVGLADDVEPPSNWFSMKTLRSLLQRLEPHEAPAAVLDPDEAMDEESLRMLRCPTCQGELSRDGPRKIHCSGCGAEYPVYAGVPKMLTPPDAPFAETLRSKLERESPGLSATDLDDLLSLSERLRFELPEPLRATSFLKGDAAGWEFQNALRVDDEHEGGGVVVRATDRDPMLLSPRLRIPLSRLKRVKVRVACAESQEASEFLQIYFWSLKKPVWWELGSAIAEYPTDGVEREIVLDIPPHFHDIPDDELIRLRVDPGHGPGRYAIRCLELLTE
ncbi:MAG TPA: methyltransferase domain-containing protein [Planctomycetes bacterium]|nr:methyltransferase domain-containing protein [Planctomycetota bacterium]